MARKVKIMENEKHALENMKIDEIGEKPEKWEMHTWNMARKLKITENDNNTR